MKEYNCVQAIFMSFYSGKLYRDVARNWGAGTFLYLLLVLTICWAILMVPVQRNVTHGISETMNDMTVDWPQTITVKEGVVSTPENRPYLIKDNKTNETVVVIDTSGQYTLLQDTQAMLVTKDSMMYWDNAPHNGGKMTVQKIPSSVSFVMDPIKIKGTILNMADWAWILILPFVVIFSFFYRILLSVFYALIGKLFALLTGIPIFYTDVVKLAMVALTPTIIISTIFEWYGKWSYYSGLFFMLSVAYVIFAVYANRRNQTDK